MNAYYMQQQGIDNGGVQHATQTRNAANAIASNLATVMGNPGNAFNSYSTTSNNMPTQEFGSGNSAALGAPQFAYLDRGQPSNVFVVPQQLPDFDFSQGTSAMYNNDIKPFTGTVTSAADGGTNNYLLGYIDGITPDKTWGNNYFVPLRPGAKPHLVSRQLFVNNNAPSVGSNTFNWKTPVANAVSQAAAKQDAEKALGQFAAYGQIQPIDANGSPLAIRHGFIRLINGAASPASGFAAGNTQDVFVFTMNDPQFYPADKNGKALPYFVGQSSLPDGTNPAQYIKDIVTANSKGQTPNCSDLSVGYALAGDTVGQGGVSAANCASIAQLPAESDPSTILNNTNLSDPASAGNKAMSAYNTSDPLGYYAKPLLEQAYGIQPPQATGSNGQSVSVGDIINLALLSARAQGQNFTAQAGQYNSGIAFIPIRNTALSSPNFKIAQQPEGAQINSSAGTSYEKEGVTQFGTTWNFLTQRMFEIDPNLSSYIPPVPGDALKRPNIDVILSQCTIPMAGQAFIYYSTSGNGGKGGLVMKDSASALLDAPWLNSFYKQAADGKAPKTPTEVNTFPLQAQGGTGGDPSQGMIDVDNDWGFPHPYDGAPNISITNWYAVTPCSGYNNLLGEINMGATNTNGSGTCPPTGSSYILNVGTGPGGSDTITVPAQGGCNGTTTATGPC
jgi:hypothetical protein